MFVKISITEAPTVKEQGPISGIEEKVVKVITEYRDGA